MKIIIISIILSCWSVFGHAYSCTASTTNDDPTVIISCYTKMLIHFRDLLREQLAFQYANHLRDNREKLLEGKFRRKYYSKMFDELEQIQRLRKRLLYPDPRPAVRCETGDDDSG